MTERWWPEDKARAWLLQTAAAFCAKSLHVADADYLIRCAVEPDDSWMTEAGFRHILSSLPGWYSGLSDAAVAEVHGDTPKQEQDVAAETIARLTHERNELGRAIAEAARKGGIYNGEVPLTGPDLLLLAQNLGEALAERSTVDEPADAPTHREPRSNVGHCVVANINTFFTPGGVEPTKWRSR